MRFDYTSFLYLFFLLPGKHSPFLCLRYLHIRSSFPCVLPPQAISSSVSRKVVLMDVERGATLLAYDNCASPQESPRQPLATHPALPHLAACPAVNGRGITLLDLRMPLPLDFIYDVSAELFIMGQVYFTT